jgi:hypothetical protein
LQEKFTMHIFDIETGADPIRARALMPPFDENDVKVGNIKDLEKIANNISASRLNHESKWMDKAALRPETGQVLAIGVIPSGESHLIFHVHLNNEPQTISDFWDFFQSKREDNNLWLMCRQRGECNCSLDHVAKSLGCGSKNGNGAEFAALYVSDEQAALEYLRNDLTITGNVARKLGVV